MHDEYWERATVTDVTFFVVRASGIFMQCLKTARAARAYARMKVFQPGAMEWGAAQTRIHLLDLSRGGALVYAQQPPAVGSIVRFVEPACLSAARVVWARGKRFGVAFAAPISDTLIDMVIAEQERLTEDLVNRPPLRR